jgi:hypothetical protein
VVYRLEDAGEIKWVVITERRSYFFHAGIGRVQQTAPLGHTQPREVSHRCAPGVALEQGEILRAGDARQCRKAAGFERLIEVLRHEF